MQINNKRSSTLKAAFIALIAFTSVSIFSCTQDHQVPPGSSIDPKGPKPAWAPDIHDEMWAVIEKLLSYGDTPIPQLTPQQARMNHTVKDAVTDLLAENNITAPAPQVDTTGADIDVAGGKVHARIYTPRAGTAPYPVIVYYHGGGWVIAGIDVYDASAAALSEQVGAVVVSVGYRKGPEFKFPTAHNDAFTAYQWVLAHTDMLKANPAKVGVAGESAGGNLAANVSIRARDAKITLPKHQLLVYPVANSDTMSTSYKQYYNAKPLDVPSLYWFLGHYLNNISEAKDPRISLVAADLKGLPSTTIIAAQIDPLTTEGMLLNEKLQAADVQTTYQLYAGTTHEFFGTAAIVPEAKQAQALAASRFKEAFK
ncbi:alpha/beta hydrolase [Dyadobacter sandarakinus]|uniref:Alpha/beta hydrolase n=1 Tax=Dyadobacter sandarakinus TaxID=2747268 RepID=A0ABX7I6N3_9BACT|nr:alpha/beta hydrolase [Dyadobacter sandarakinus]QRR00636.1 alpha/beta hydrolase [Dyadobacter sandarakinus]